MSEAVAAGLAWRRGSFSVVALVRTLALGTLLLMLGELVAEERGLWHIPEPLGLLFLSAPVEGGLLVVATLLNSLVLYWLLEHRWR